MSRTWSKDGKLVMGTYGDCMHKIDELCNCDYTPMDFEAGKSCSVCKFFSIETGAELPEQPKCKWLQDEVCCNGDCPMVADFPDDACIVCGWWENETL